MSANKKLSEMTLLRKEESGLSIMLPAVDAWDLLKGKVQSWELEMSDGRRYQFSLSAKPSP